MAENKHTMSDLYQMQSLPLKHKVQMTRQRIRGWIDTFGEDGVYISFSGGKDSTVLLDLVRKEYPNVEAIYVDTGLEYPEIREFVKSFDNVTILKSKMNFRQVIEKYGYPFISKEVSNNVDGAKRYIENLTDRQTDRQTDRFRIPTTTEEYVELANMLNKDWGKTKGSPQRLAKLLGIYTYTKEKKANIPNKDRSIFSMEKYKFLLNSPFKISDKCCGVMKKGPAHSYYRQTKKKPIIATMASESRLRTQKWLQNGCNGFNMTIPTSTPMSFWTEQDVLLYIKMNNLPICSVYGDIVEDTEMIGQQSIFDYEGVASKELFESDMPTLTTTGCKRTGCMFCGYGCHLNNDTRFIDMKTTHPKTYEWIMKPWKEGGLNYKEVIDWLNENGNLNIKY